MFIANHIKRRNVRINDKCLAPSMPLDNKVAFNHLISLGLMHVFDQQIGFILLCSLLKWYWFNKQIHGDGHSLGYVFVCLFFNLFVWFSIISVWYFAFRNQNTPFANWQSHLGRHKPPPPSPEGRGELNYFLTGCAAQGMKPTSKSKYFSSSKNKNNWFD